MSILDDDDQGVESQLIDPFITATISHEAYAFPEEQFIPIKVNDTQPEETPISVVPMIDGLGAANVELTPESVNPSLAVVETAPEESNVSDITDTPQDPVEGDGTHVSFEMTEDELQDSDKGDALIEVYDRLKEIGGVCKNDVVQVESISPGLLIDHRPLNMFSVISTPIGLEVSLESIGKEISKTIKSMLAAFIKHVRNFITWLINHLFEGRKTDNLNKIKDRWSKVEALAASKDASKGMGAFRKQYGDSDVGRKASTTPHFIQLYAESLLKEISETKTTLGVRSVSNGKLFNEVTEQFRYVDEIRKAVGDALVSLHANGTANLDSSVNAKTYIEMLARTKAKYAEKSTLHTTNINNALNIKDAIDNNRDRVKALTEYMKSFERNLTDMEKKVDKGDISMKDTKDGITLTRNGFSALTTAAAILDLYFEYYQEYFNILTAVINKCERKLQAIV